MRVLSHIVLGGARSFPVRERVGFRPLQALDRWVRRFAVPLGIAVACFAVAYSAPSRGDLRPNGTADEPPRQDHRSRFAADLADGSGARGAESERRSLAGQLQIPVDGVKPADLLDTYDDPRSGGRTHEAIDIMAPRGTAVLAAAGGTVARLFRNRLGGLALYLYPSGGGVVHYYAHLDSYAAGLKEGRRVHAGEVLGTVGSTGNAPEDAPHLHFAIRRLDEGESWWQGEPVDPYPLLFGEVETGDEGEQARP